MNNINLASMSPEALRSLANEAIRMAEALEAERPSVGLALAAGILDRSYSTVRWGTVASYSGEVEITMANGRRWKAIGHRPTGCAEWIDRQGYVEFIPLE